MSCKPACPVCCRLRGAALELVGAGGTGALSHDALDRAAELPDGEAAQHYPNIAACLQETYAEVSESLLAELTEPFYDTVSWDSALALARARLLGRLAARPAEARLSFVETLRGDRGLRRLREIRRRRLVAFLDDQRARRGEPSSRMQIELLTGAMFHEISTAVEAGRTAELPALEPRLSELAHLFDPAERRPRLVPLPHVGFRPMAEEHRPADEAAWSAH
jgi:DNA-binding transcriptional regulator YbjK